MQQVSKAISAIDYSKMNIDIQKALAQMDSVKLKQEIASALNNINWNDMKADVAQSMDSAKAAIAGIDWDQMKSDLQKAQADVSKELAKQHINSDSIRLQVQQAMKQAQKGLHEAQQEIALQYSLPKALADDGLIDVNKPYRIELKDGSLYLNGVKQSKAVTDKYSRYFSGKKNFVVKKSKDDMD